MTTVGQMTDRILQRMGARKRVQIDTLTAGITDSDSTLALDTDHVGAQAHGSILEVGTEQMFVQSYSAPNYTIQRGWNGTTAAAHSLGDLVYVNPRYPRSLIIQLIEEEIRSWPNDVGKITSAEVSFGTSTFAADSGLGAGVDLRRMLRLKTEPYNTWDTWRDLDFILIRDSDASDFTSGYGVQPTCTPFGVTTVVHVEALVGYTLTNIATEATELETTVGVTATMLEALMYGVMDRAMAGEEVQRTDERYAQQQQRDQRVPPTFLSQTASIYLERRNQAIAAETRRINAEYPYRKTSAG